MHQLRHPTAQHSCANPTVWQRPISNTTYRLQQGCFTGQEAEQEGALLEEACLHSTQHHHRCQELV